MPSDPIPSHQASSPENAKKGAKDKSKRTPPPSRGNAHRGRYSPAHTIQASRGAPASGFHSSHDGRLRQNRGGRLGQGSGMYPSHLPSYDPHPRGETFARGGRGRGRGSPRVFRSQSSVPHTGKRRGRGQPVDSDDDALWYMPGTVDEEDEDEKEHGGVDGMGKELRLGRRAMVTDISSEAGATTPTKVITSRGAIPSDRRIWLETSKFPMVPISPQANATAPYNLESDAIKTGTEGPTDLRRGGRKGKKSGKRKTRRKTRTKEEGLFDPDQGRGRGEGRGDRRGGRGFGRPGNQASSLIASTPNPPAITSGRPRLNVSAVHRTIEGLEECLRALGACPVQGSFSEEITYWKEQASFRQSLLEQYMTLLQSPGSASVDLLDKAWREGAHGLVDGVRKALRRHLRSSSQEEDKEREGIEGSLETPGEFFRSLLSTHLALSEEGFREVMEEAHAHQPNGCIGRLPWWKVLPALGDIARYRGMYGLASGGESERMRRWWISRAKAWYRLAM
ncbi:hypothetical protein BJ684DRAFT_15275, partial [Piptocephalis cylindrospora]